MSKGDDCYSVALGKVGYASPPNTLHPKCHTCEQIIYTSDTLMNSSADCQGKIIYVAEYKPKTYFVYLKLGRHSNPKFYRIRNKNEITG